MITCEFWGRLGNNMFQIATTIATAKKLNTDFVLPTNTSVGHVGTPVVNLDIFDYSFNRANIDCEFEYRETTFEYKDISIKNNTKLFGFFQSYKYFDSIKNDIQNLYFYPNKNILDELKNYEVSENSLGISVRRGDYLMLQDNHCVLDVSYYQNVLDTYFQNNIDQIFIFSDDIDWCKTIFGENVIYVENTIGVQLFLMTRMKNLIISNSTFAWWGAYLNQNNGLIIAPTPWFGPNLSDKITDDLYCDNWIKQSHEIVVHPYNITKNMFI